MLGWLKRKPDEIIGGDAPYLLRWHLIPRNRWLNVYLHKFLRDDDDRAHHDHPWHSLSIATGDYLEIITPPTGWADRHTLRRRAYRPIFRRATHTHRIILFRDRYGKPVPLFTLFLTGPRVREWGFHCPKGWRHWKDFCGERDQGKVGRGCL